MKKIIGHTSLREKLFRKLSDNEFHSTLLFAGPEGIGKKLIAEELLKKTLCFANESLYPCEQCQSCVSFDAGNHPDFISVDCRDKELAHIDGIRKILYALSLKPFQGKAHAVLFDNVESLSIPAHNVLLKTLEEPQQNTWFILITANSSKIPITIRSRCQVWGFNPLRASELNHILEEMQVQNEVRVKLDRVLLMDGSVQSYLHYASNPEEWDAVKRILHEIFGGDIEAWWEGIHSWSKDRDAIMTILHFMRLVAHDALRTAKNNEDTSRWAVFMSNVLAADRLIFERNISALLVFQHILRCLLPQPILDSFTDLPNSASLIENIVV